MHVVLVCIDNFQEYILTNVKQLVRLGHKSIYVVTNGRFFYRFAEYYDKIQLVAIEDLTDSYNYNQKTQLDNQFRGGFWALTSARFFYLYEFMRSRDIENVIHLENDVLIYHNVDGVLDMLIPDRTKIYLPFDTFTRSIASIMFIPNHSIFKSVLDNYDVSKNDMENFSIIQSQTGLIDNFPIFISDPDGSPEHQFVTKNFNQFNMIFDAAAMGQYLGGVDPQNIPGDTTGFVNETCIIKYDQYDFIWNAIDGIKCPFIGVTDSAGTHCSYPIFNLHIHSKALDKFM
jgi:hypothetical protein